MDENVKRTLVRLEREVTAAADYTQLRSFFAFIAATIGRVHLRERREYTPKETASQEKKFVTFGFHSSAI